jgi:hypothetical protein
MDSADLGPNSNHLGVMITLRMRLQCSIVRSGQAAPEQVGLAGWLVVGDAAVMTCVFSSWLPATGAPVAREAACVIVTPHQPTNRCMRC